MIKTHELKNGQGFIKYKTPNVPDLLIMFGFMKMDQSKMSDVEYLNENQMFMIGNLIKKLDYFIVEFDVNDNGIKVDSFEKLLEMPVLLSDLVEIAADLIGSLNVSDSEKK